MSVLSETDLSFLPSDEDLARFNEKGWYQSPVIISEELLEAAVDGADKFYSGDRDFNLPNNVGIADDQNSAEHTLRNNEFVTLQSKALQNIGFHPLVCATAAKLAGAEEMRLFADSLICKKPTKKSNPGVVGWHTDKAYWGDVPEVVKTVVAG